MATTDKKQTTRAAGTRAAKSPAARDTAAGKQAAKAAPRTTRKKAAPAGPKVSLVFQYQGRELSQAGMVEAVTNAWISAGHDAAALETMELYVKPEDSAVYYVINGAESGKFDF